MGNVKIFRSTDAGAPTLYGNAGYLIPILDACLVNGYGQQNVTSLSNNAGLVTVTTTSNHLLTSASRQTIAGSSDNAYNGEFVITVTGGNTFTYTTTGITNNNPTGTITTKTASAGWTKPYNTTNIGVYRGGSGLQHYYRFDDTVTNAARVVGYETMSGVSTGTNAFPSNTQFAGGLYWIKSTTADATNARPWIMYADDKTMYMWVQYYTFDYSGVTMHGMGEFTPIAAGDAYTSFLSANTGTSYSVTQFGLLGLSIGVNLQSTVTGMYSPRSYTQLGTSVVLGKIGDSSKAAQSWMGNGGLLPYPHPVDNGLYMCPIGVTENGVAGGQSYLRGTLRGIWNPLHALPLAHLDTFAGNGAFAGKTFQALSFCPGTSSLGQAFFDTSLTW